MKFTTSPAGVASCTQNGVDEKMVTVLPLGRRWQATGLLVAMSSMP